MEAGDFSKIKCKQADCKVSETGVCLEGILETCSHKFFGDSVEVQNASENTAETQAVDLLKDNGQPSYSGDAMLIEECGAITSSSLTRLIILAGNASSGKTTMLATLFQMFQERSNFAGYKFAGSRSLIGLEKRCFKSRLTSEREKADTDRTIFLEYDEFIHLKVKKGSDPSVNLLFTDVSGEKFKTISKSVAESKKFELAKRADHFVLFMDAFLLSDDTTKHLTKTKSLNILRSLIEAQVLSPETYIEVIFSRWDLLLKRDPVECHKEFVELVKAEILEKFGATHKRISFYEVANRPDSGLGIEAGFGINQVLPIWVEKSPFIPETITLSNPEVFIKDGMREALKYKFI